MKKSSIPGVLLLAFFILSFSTHRAHAEFHHVEGCFVCHAGTAGECAPYYGSPYHNLDLIACEILTPQGGARAVRFLCDFSGSAPCDPQGTNSYADGDGNYDGVCEVCHTQTIHHRADGNNPDPDPHYGGTHCISCHPHADEFSHGGNSGHGCIFCHGHDAGYEYEPGELSKGKGTACSHSTHTEDDADDLKGPAVQCGVCHDTANYPYFASGTDGDGDGRINLAETDVCDSCHSRGGSFDGVESTVNGAKANWDQGVYQEDGVTLKAGKDHWCAGCHDEEPAFSKPESTEVIVDNGDPGAGFSGVWGVSSWAPGFYGADYRYHAPGSGSDTFTWEPAIPAPGVYSVYARWTQDPSRSPNATYTIFHDGGSTPVAVDQRTGGGTWGFLGTFGLDGIDDEVMLVQSPDGYVIADAVKFESGGPGTFAPNVIGDNTTYGFYVTGHKIACLACHDAAKRHLDGEHRTYRAGVTFYGEGYRLRDIEGQPAMNIPRPLYPVNTNPLVHSEDFVLCFDCHNRNEVLTSTGAPGKTNFWNSDSSPANSHNIHLGIGTSHFDSDWNGSADSSETCIACHNVHGSPSRAMIRHGELIGSPGMGDKVPALNFAYLAPPPPGLRDGAALLQASIGGSFALSGPTIAQNGVCNACHWGLNYLRSPYLGPRVLQPKAEPAAVDIGDGPQDVLLTATILDHDENVSAVTVDLAPVGGGVEYMLDQGGGLFIFEAIVPDTVDPGVKSIRVTAADSENTGDNRVLLTVTRPGVEIVDNTDPGAASTGTWSLSTYAPGYIGINYHYHSPGAGTDIFTWTPSLSSAGTYEVFARWTQDPSRATDAAYTVRHDGGSTQVVKDQTVQGGMWVSLGTYGFDGAGDSVELAQNPGGYVIADAVKWELRP